MSFSEEMSMPKHVDQVKRASASYSFIQLHTASHSFIQLHTASHSFTQLHTASHSFLELSSSSLRLQSPGQACEDPPRDQRNAAEQIVEEP